MSNNSIENKENNQTITSNNNLPEEHTQQSLPQPENEEFSVSIVSEVLADQFVERW